MHRPLAQPTLFSLCLVLALPSGAAAERDGLRLGPLGASREEVLDRQVDEGTAHRPVLSQPLPVVPSPALPAGLGLQQSNNNLAIALHAGRLFLAFRTAPTHFASAKARLVVLSSPDLGRSWTHETSIATGRDLREPFLLEVNGRLFLYFAEMGVRAYAFEPRALWRSTRCGAGCWSAPVVWGGPEEVAWDFKIRGGRAWMTSYRGKHYSLGSHAIEARFSSSPDAVVWTDVGDGPVYRGGVTESSFEFDRSGNLWAVTRNEDGDGSGFGSHVATAPRGRPGVWSFPARSDPSRFDSPRMFRHGREIYVLARRDLGPPAGSRFEAVPGGLRKLLIWASYSLQPKRTALFRLDREAKRLEHLLDLPSAGDTAFPSIVRLSANDFLVANYSSAFRHSERSWLRGQLSGTGIYFVRLRFEPLAAQAAAAEPGSEAPAAAGEAARPAPPPVLALDEAWPQREGSPTRWAAVGGLLLAAIAIARRRARGPALTPPGPGAARRPRAS